MPFIDRWRESAPDTLAKATQLVPLAQDADLKFELMVVGLLWSARQPVQDFEVDALAAVQEIVGGRAVSVLQMVQQWDDDMLTAARQLAAQSPRSSELETGLKKLVAHFGAFSIFAKQLALNAAAPKPAKSQPAAAPRVVVAYVQRDGVELAAEVRKNLEAEGIPTWPDLGLPPRRRDWWAQVTHAIEQVEYLVLVMTPAAVQSQIIRRQWRHASQVGTCIFPVTRADDIDFPQLPRWIRQVHFFNLPLEWPKLVAALKTNCQTPRLPFMADDLPADFVERPAEMKQILSVLFDPQREEALPGVVALHGAGGYGKTTLAQAICHNDDIRQVFDNGILWVTLGERPGDLSRPVIDLIELLSGERPGFSGLDAAVVRLIELLSDRELLLVLDDVWDVAHLKPFLQGGPSCARLITTQNVTILPLEAKAIEIGPMQPAEGVSLLRRHLPPGGDSELHALHHRMGGWPLLLTLTNGTLRDRVQKYKQSLPQAVVYVNRALDQRGLTAFDSRNDSDRDLAVNQTITVSLELLEPDDRRRFNEMAIFPEDVDIPLATLEVLWKATGGLDDFDTEELCDHLHSLSLLSKFDLTGRVVRLHNVMRSYLHYRQGAQLVKTHDHFLNAYLASIKQWANLPVDDSYMWTHLAYHLLQANRAAELGQIVEDLRYLAAKIFTKGVHYAESDLKIAQSVGPQPPTRRALQRIVSQAGHLLARTKTPAEVINTLHSRMVEIPELASVAAAAPLPLPALTARHMLPDLPNPMLIRTLWGHTAGVLDCAISADGTTTVSVDKDNTVIVWHTNTGEAKFRIEPYGADVWTCAVNAAGSRVVLGSVDGQVTLVDPAGESITNAWPAHNTAIVSCCVSADGSVVVTASKDKTLKVWQAGSGRLRWVLAGHERTVTRCDISADGRTVVSAANDGVVKIWDAATGQQRHSFTIGSVDSGIDRLTFYSQRDINFSCAISADGALVAAASSAGALNLWQVGSGQLKFSVVADKRGVYGCALSADGHRVVAALSTGVLKVFDADGALQLTLDDHTRIVNACSISGDGRHIVSASDDKTVKVWDGDSADGSLMGAAYQQPAYHCALTADGRLAVTAVADNRLIVWDVTTGTELTRLHGHTRQINGCAISADGNIVVSASQDQSVKIWNARTGRPQFTLTGHTWAVNDCAIDAADGLIVTASEDSTLKVWQAQTGAERFTLTGHSRAVKSCALNGNGSIAVSASADGTLRLWNPHTGEQRALLTGHTALVNTCAISTDGRTVVSASLDKTLKVWDTRPAAERLSLIGHEASVTGCALSADGRLVVSASRDKTVRVWDAGSGDCLATLFVDEPLHDCACSADAGSIVAVSSSGVYFLQLVQ